MFCPKCGKMNPDDRENCSGCGAVLHEPKPETPKKKKGLGAKIAAAVVALAVVIGGTAVAVTSCDGGENSGANNVVAEACYVGAFR